MFQPFLGQVTDSRAPGQLDLARVNLAEPGQQSQQGGLAGTVLTAQADPVGRPHMPVDIAEDHLVAKLFNDILQLQHEGCYNTSCDRRAAISRGGPDR